MGLPILYLKGPQVEDLKLKSKQCSSHLDIPVYILLTDKILVPEVYERLKAMCSVLDYPNTFWLTLNTELLTLIHSWISKKKYDYYLINN